MIRFKNIDLFRFLFAILIVMAHARKIIELPTWLSGIKNCGVCVDFFFVIAGFLLFFKIGKESNTWEFTKKRFFRLAPNVWLSIILVGVFSLFISGIKWNLSGNFLRILLLHNIGFSLKTGGTSLGISWFVSSLFWTSIFYFYIYKVFEKKYLNLIIWLLVVFSYTIIQGYQNIPGGNDTNIYLIFNKGVCKAVANMGLGYFISMAYNNGFLQNVEKKGIVIISLLEIYLIGFLSHYLIFSSQIPCETKMGYIIPFTILFYFMLIKKGIISNLLENNISSILGQYSYSIYCFHGLVLSIFKFHIYKHNPIILSTHPLCAYFFETFCAVMVGVILYYAFEKPINNYIKKKISAA